MYTNVRKVSIHVSIVEEKGNLAIMVYIDSLFHISPLCSKILFYLLAELRYR